MIHDQNMVLQAMTRSRIAPHMAVGEAVVQIVRTVLRRLLRCYFFSMPVTMTASLLCPLLSDVVFSVNDEGLT